MARARHMRAVYQDGRKGRASEGVQERKEPKGEDICCLLTASAVAEQLQPEGSTMPTGTPVNYLLPGPIVDACPCRASLLWVPGLWKVPSRVPDEVLLVGIVYFFPIHPLCR